MPQTKIPPGWYAKLHAVTEAIDKREGSARPEASQVVKASRMTPRDNLSRWVSAVSLYHVKDGKHEYMVVVMDRGDEANPVEQAECSCDAAGEICAHILAVLASHTGPLT